MLDFDGRVAIVTGGGRGIGRAHSEALAERGCRVVIADAALDVNGIGHQGDPAAEAVEAIRAAGGTAVAVRADVRTDAKAIVQAAMETFGKLDILINNAGSLGCFERLADVDLKAWRNVVATHYDGTVAMCHAAWRYLAASGAGRIVNTCSAVMFGDERLSDYGSAKAAVFGLTRMLALEGAADGINVNCILPLGSTRMIDTIPDPDLRKAIGCLLPVKQVAALVVWMVHQETRISGEALSIAGRRASRIVIAEAPQVLVETGTPEEWSASGERLFDGGALKRLSTTSNSFAADLAALDPSIAEKMGARVDTGLARPT